MRNIAVVTNCWNERFFLPRWIDYYGGQFGRSNLFVLDDGSDDGSTEALGDVSVIRLPKAPFSDTLRRDFVQCLCRNLLRRFDGFIYADSDEFLVVDPERHGSLAEYLATYQGRTITAIGLNVLHLPAIDPPFDPTQPILAQRRHVEFSSGFCKPLITRVPLKWSNGFHFCSVPPAFGAVYLLHLKHFDFELSFARSQQIHSVRSDSLKHSLNRQQLLDQLARRTSRPVRAGFDFSEQIELFLRDFEKNHEGIHARTVLMPRVAVLHRVPEPFTRLV